MLSVIDGQRVIAEAMPRYLPGEPLSPPPRPPVQDVVVQLFSHQNLAEPILIPAVVAPLLVLVLSGAATVEERTLDGEWQATDVEAGDFFLTNTSEPYEMRWQVQGDGRFEVMHLYLGLPLIEQAARDLLGDNCSPVSFLDVSGARDERVSFLLEQLRLELYNERDGRHRQSDRISIVEVPRYGSESRTLCNTTCGAHQFPRIASNAKSHSQLDRR